MTKSQIGNVFRLRFPSDSENTLIVMEMEISYYQTNCILNN
jgi:hypothetical protein